MKTYHFKHLKHNKSINKVATIIYHLVFMPLIVFMFGFCLSILIDKFFEGLSVVNLMLDVVLTPIAFIWGIIQLIRDHFRNPGVFLYDEFIEITPESSLSDSFFIRKHFHIVQYEEIESVQIVRQYKRNRLSYPPNTSPISVLIVGFVLLFNKVGNDFIAGESHYCVCLTLKNGKSAYFGIENAEEFVKEVQEKIDIKE